MKHILEFQLFLHLVAPSSRSFTPQNYVWTRKARIVKLICTSSLSMVSFCFLFVKKSFAFPLYLWFLVHN